MADYSGFPITMNALPTEATASVANGITPDQFKLRLKAGGTVSLDGTDLVLGPASFNSTSLAFMALDRLELKSGARIITNGNTLMLFVNTLASQNGSIISFRPDELKANNGANGVAPGSPGQAGSPGDNAGLVSIHIVEGIEGNLTVQLSGQTGGDGGSGAQGLQGTRGAKGANAVDGIGYCAAGGQDGGQGNPGSTGGTGGSAGPGGHGGYLEVINIGPSPLPEAAFTFSAPGGLPGAPGTGGLGGPGGDGGEGGNGSHFCGGGHGGSNGPAGSTGVSGTPSTSGGPGQFLRKNLDLQSVVNQATNTLGYRT